MTLVSAWRRVTAYFASDDARVGIGNTVAMIVVGNQPFYPFYVWAAVGAFTPAAFWIWLSTPLFLAAPALARRSHDLGRAVLLAASIGNTALSAWVLGVATGVELFYLPCLLVAWAIVPAGRRVVPLMLTSAAIAAGLAAGRWAKAPLAGLSPVQDHSLVTMNTVSVACLMAVVGFQAWRVSRMPPQPKRCST